MPANSNQPAEEQQEAVSDTRAEGQERLPEAPPSIEIAEAGSKLALAEQPAPTEGDGQGEHPTLPDVAPPYHDEAASDTANETTSSTASSNQFNPQLGDRTTPLPPPDGVDEAGAAQTAASPLVDEGQAPTLVEDQTAPLPSLNGSDESQRRAAVTSPLTEEELPQELHAPPADLTPLERDTVVDGRYAITNVVQSQPQGATAHNIYRSVDEKSAEQCWVCGSTSNKPGELYCSNCGAQLANKVYWLRESRANGSENMSGAGLLLSRSLGQTQGFGRIFRTFRENNRDYSITEEGAGQPLTSFAPLAANGDPVGDEKLLGWAESLAAALRPLHEAGIALGDLSTGNINIVSEELPRINDVSAAHEAGENDRKADVQALAQTLGQFLMHPLDPAAPPKSGEPSSLTELFAQAIAGQYPDAGSFAAALEKYREEGIMPPTLSILAAAGSDVGMVRKLNEDSVLLLDFDTVEESNSRPVTLMVVADGMGGHDSGEVASSMAVRTIAAQVAQSVLGPAIFNYGTSAGPLQEGELDIMAGGEQVGELLRSAVAEANKAIVQYSRARKSDMGTTCVACLIVGNNAYFTNVGDSRGYLYRDGKLEQITEDHSLAWRLVQAGQLAREDIRTFERRNEIYRSLGDDVRMEIDLFSIKLRPYDVILLCSDGLWEMVHEEDVKGKAGIASLIEHSDDPHTAVQRLLAAANAGGGEDNIGVVVAQLLVNGDEEEK